MPEVTVDIFGTSHVVKRGQLLYVAGSCAAIVNLDAVPAAWELGDLRRDSLFDRVEAVICPERKRAGGWRIMTQGH